jgi:acyl-coenzyme A synthetase/AMP-(fatty) acid ligase
MLHRRTSCDQLRNELKDQVVKMMGKTLRLRFVKALPKTRSAKILRKDNWKKWPVRNR